MICLEVKFDENRMMEMEDFLVRSHFIMFDISHQWAGCLKLYVSEKEKNKVRNGISSLEFVEEVRIIELEEVSI